MSAAGCGKKWPRAVNAGANAAPRKRRHGPKMSRGSQRPAHEQDFEQGNADFRDNEQDDRQLP